MAYFERMNRNPACCLADGQSMDMVIIGQWVFSLVVSAKALILSLHLPSPYLRFHGVAAASRETICSGTAKTLLAPACALTPKDPRALDYDVTREAMRTS